MRVALSGVGGSLGEVQRSYAVTLSTSRVQAHATLRVVSRPARVIARILPVRIRHDRKAGAFKSFPLAAIFWCALAGRIRDVMSASGKQFLTALIRDVLNRALGNEAIFPYFQLRSEGRR